MNNLIVQKYGGATLSTPEKIRSAALTIRERVQQGQRLVIVVSAMGSTTNELLGLAHAVAKRPSRREMDMLLSTGERVSMALLSMALQDLDVSAISFTGSQAGILTNTSHSNAFIEDVKAFRVEESLQAGKVVVLAGFQGVNPHTKEITTLGRGGSDTSAVAMTAYLKAQRCEILKDVPAVFTADPKIVKNAREIPRLNYQQMMEMTFWGAKVLHYRSVELASRQKILLYVGPAHKTSKESGTLIQGEENMYESSQIITINSFSDVLEIQMSQRSSSQAINYLRKFLDQNEISFPQILNLTSSTGEQKILATGPSENISAIKEIFKSSSDFKLNQTPLSSVTATCTGMSSGEITEKILNQMSQENIVIHQLLQTAMSMTLIVNSDQKEKCIQSLHGLIA